MLEYIKAFQEQTEVDAKFRETVNAKAKNSDGGIIHVISSPHVVEKYKSLEKKLEKCMKELEQERGKNKKISDDLKQYKTKLSFGIRYHNHA